MRRAARTDANQREIVLALRRIGASVAVASKMGGGFPDLVVGYRGRNWLLELKRDDVSPSRSTLTPDQVEWNASWLGQWAVVRNVDEAIEVVTR